MKFKLILVLSMFSWSLFGQEIPADSMLPELAKAFEKAYPDAKLRSWEAKSGKFIINARIDGQQAQAFFSPDYNWTETAFVINQKEMPGRINTYLDKHYPGGEILLAQYRETNENTAFYYLQLKKPGSKQEKDSEFFFDVSGNFMKKNDFIPITEAISSSTAQEAARKEKMERERLEYETKREALLKMDRSVAADDLPARIRENFRKKFPKAEETRWDTLDNIYSAYFLLDAVSATAEFNPEGDWLKTTEVLQDGPGFRPIEVYLEQNHPGEVLRLVRKTSTRDKLVNYYLEVHPKVRKNVTPAITKLYFDKNGRLEKAEEPDPSVSMIIESDTATDMEEEEDDDHFNRQVEKDAPVQRPEGDLAAIKVSPKELPSSVLGYIATNYPTLKIKEAYFSDYEEVGNAYKVVISKPGLNQATSDLYFSDFGKLLLEVNPPPKAGQKSDNKDDSVDAGDTEQETSVILEEEVIDDIEEETGEEGDGEQDLAYELSDSDVPEPVKKSFSRRYPRAEEVIWKSDEKRYFVEFFHNQVKNILEFTPDGIIQATRTEMDPGNIFGPVQRYLDDNYPAYRVRYAEKIVRKDRKDFFYIEIYSRKKNANPPEAQLYFNKVGKPMENPPE